MTIPIDPKWVADSERFARLRASGRAWLADLDATHADMQRHLDSPMACFLLPENGAPEEVALERNDVPMSGGALSLLRQLETCTTQEQVCEVLARGGDSTVDLNGAAVHIRRAGLSKAETDRGLVKNLGSRLLESGRWERVRPGVYGLKGAPVAEGSRAGSADGQMNPLHSEGDDSEDGMLPGIPLDTCPSDRSSCPGLPHESEPLSSEIADSSLL